MTRLAAASNERPQARVRELVASARGRATSLSSIQAFWSIRQSSRSSATPAIPRSNANGTNWSRSVRTNMPARRNLAAVVCPSMNAARFTPAPSAAPDDVPGRKIDVVDPLSTRRLDEDLNVEDAAAPWSASHSAVRRATSATGAAHRRG